MGKALTIVFVIAFILLFSMIIRCVVISEIENYRLKQENDYDPTVDPFQK